MLDFHATSTRPARRSRARGSSTSPSTRAATAFTGRALAGRYVLRSWVNDVTPPSLQLLTTRVSAGRPTLVSRVTDTQSGVDPRSLVDRLPRRRSSAAASYDPRHRARAVPAPARRRRR